MASIKYAKEADDEVERITDATLLKLQDIITTTKLKKMSDDGFKSISSAFGKGISEVITITRDLADQELSSGFKKYGGTRSYALGGGFSSKVSDFYSRYIPMITGGFTSQTIIRIQSLLQKMDDQGLSVRDSGAYLGVLFDKGNGYGRNIVRTEGTRAAALARRQAAKEATLAGYGPQYYIYKALMDKRTTDVCRDFNNKYWKYAEDKIQYHPPQHFFCRAGVIFGWDASLEDGNYQKLTPKTYSRILDSRQSEFPTWVQYTKDLLVSSEDAVREIAQEYDLPNRSKRIIDDRIKSEFAESLKRSDSQAVRTIGKVLTVPMKRKDQDELKREIASNLASNQGGERNGEKVQSKRRLKK